jgi:hypothetical protein
MGCLEEMRSAYRTLIQNPEQRNHKGIISVNDRIILKYMFYEYCVKMWTDLARETGLRRAVCHEHRNEFWIL